MKPVIYFALLSVLPFTFLTKQDGCETEDPTPTPAPWSNGWPIEVAVDGEPLIEGSFDDVAPVWWVIDTGASLTYADETLTHSVGMVRADITIGPIEEDSYYVGSVDLREAEAFIGWDLGGLMGQDLFDGRFVAVDYAGLKAFFADVPWLESPPGTSVQTPFILPYEVISLIPVSTVGLDDGLDSSLITDTGSGVTLITDEVFDLIDDGTLPILHGYVWATTYGAGDSFVTRIPTIRAGGLEVRDSWAVVVPASNAFFELLELSGIYVDGFLGYPFYRHFVFGVDGISRDYMMWPLDTDAHIDPHEWHRVGIEPSWREGGFFVEMVYRPSDAHAKGLEVGDQILGMDSSDLSEFTLDELKLGLRGEVGETRRLRLLRDGEEFNVEVLVQDLLPGAPSVVY